MTPPTQFSTNNAKSPEVELIIMKLRYVFNKNFEFDLSQKV